MTNWMTAAGIALLAGGLATLITFRSVLFGSGGRSDDDTAGPALREVVLSWPPISGTDRPGTVFPGRPGDRPTVLEKRARPPS